MVAIVLTDLHIHNYSKFDNEGSRLNNCLDVLTQCFEAADEMVISHILFVGDLFDQQKSLPHVVINQTVKRFKLLFNTYPNIKFVAISGNHDLASNNTENHEGESALIFLNEVFDNFILIDNQRYKIGKHNIYGIPYYSRREEFLKALVNCKHDDILLIHQTPEHSNTMITPDVLINELKDYKYVLCGHIHKREHLSKNFLILGSPLHRDLGDEGQDKGINLIDLNTLEIEFIPLDFPKFKRVNSEEIQEVSEDYQVPVIEPKITHNHIPIDLSQSNLDKIMEFLTKIKAEDNEHFNLVKYIKQL